MSRPEVCVGAVAILSGRLLLVQRATEPGAGDWSLPGGRVEQGELLAEATVRELREETGLEAVCGSLVGVVERLSEHGHFVILDYFVTVLSEDGLQAGSDAADARWVALEDVAELRLVDGLAEFLHDNGILRTII